MQPSTTLGDVNDLQDLVAKLNTIYIPDERILAIDDPLLQKYIALRPNDDGGQPKLEPQLGFFLNEQLEKIDSGLEASNELCELLGRLSSYTQYSKVRTKSRFVGVRLKYSDHTKTRDNLLRTLSTEVEWTG